MTNAVYRWTAAVNSACWAIFVLFWIVAASLTKKTVYRQPVRERVLGSGLLAAGVLILEVSQRTYAMNVSFVPRTALTAIIAALLTLSGLAFALWSRVILGRNWSGRVTLKENHELIVRGPYQLVRHPIYTGLLTMALGSALLVGRVGALLGWSVFFSALWLKMNQEETLMLTQFPAEYAAYRQHVKRIIPFVL